NARIYHCIERPIVMLAVKFYKIVPAKNTRDFILYINVLFLTPKENLEILRVYVFNGNARSSQSSRIYTIHAVLNYFYFIIPLRIVNPLVAVGLAETPYWGRK